MIVSFVILVVILNVIVIQGYNNNRYINSIIRKHKYDKYRRNEGKAYDYNNLIIINH